MKKLLKVSLIAISCCVGLFIILMIPFWPEASLKTDAKGAVSQILFDPSSAQWEGLRISTRNRKVVCGLVNAKNRFGGYVGRTPFAYDALIGSAVLLDDSKKYAYREYFEDCGLPVPSPVPRVTPTAATPTPSVPTVLQALKPVPTSLDRPIAGLWDHGGSLLSLSVEGDRRKLIYEALREGLSERGVHKSTVFF
jgi:hypothetical protein